MGEWELSKENIQPLKQGRQMKKLSTILGQQDEKTVKAIQEERWHFEEELREKENCGVCTVLQTTQTF